MTVQTIPMQASHTMKSLFKRLIPRQVLNRYHAKRIHQQHIAELGRWTPDDDRYAEFYGEFVKQGQVVFDVGANMGNRSKVFRRLGAK